MKTIKTAAMTLALIMLAGCGGNTGNTEDTVTENSAAEQTLSEMSADSQSVPENEAPDNSGDEELWEIEGTAMLCTNGTVLIISDCSGGYSEPFPIVMRSDDNGIFEGILTGDVIKIAVLNSIEESYPGGAYVKSLEKVGTTEEIPREILERLEEMGYKAAGEELPDENADVQTLLCMINDVVYCSTGKTNNVPRCGNMDGYFTLIPEGEIPKENGEANFYSENAGYQWGAGNTVEACIDGNWYIFEPLSGSSLVQPEGDYPRISRRAVSRITITSEKAEREGKEPIEAAEEIRNDLAMLIEVYEAEPVGDTSGEFAPEGYIVTVYGSGGESVRYIFSRDEKFLAGENYYSFKDKAYSDNILSDITEAIRADRVTEEFGEITLEKMPPLTEETDLKLRTDYAAYMNDKFSGREVTADSVEGIYYYGTYSGYMLVVMSPYKGESTDDVITYCLRYTDEDITDPYGDCYPYIEVELPSGCYEMYAYKDGEFVPAVTAFEEGLVEYRAAKVIAEYMSEYYSGNDMCGYEVE